MEAIIKKLIARVTGKPLVTCPYAYSNYYRFMRTDGDGRKYIIIHGRVIRHGESYHKWAPILNCTSKDF